MINYEVFPLSVSHSFSPLEPPLVLIKALHLACLKAITSPRDNFERVRARREMEQRALDNTKCFKTGPGVFILIWLISEN